MEDVASTGWLPQGNASSKVIDLTPVPRIRNARIRFRGVWAITGTQETVTENRASFETTIPDATGAFTRHIISGYVIVKNATSSPITPFVWLETPWGNDLQNKTTVQPGQTYQYSLMMSSETFHGGEIVGIRGSYMGGTGMGNQVFATTYGLDVIYDYSRYISATVNSVRVDGPTILTNGTVSPWYPLALVAGQANTVIYSVEGSAKVDVEICYEIPQMNMRYKIGGVWKDIAKIFYKVDGQWKVNNEVYIKENGIWKQSGSFPAIVFSRASPAWLGGREYGAGEPRYQGGLWVEEGTENKVTNQATWGTRQGAVVNRELVTTGEWAGWYKVHVTKTGTISYVGSIGSFDVPDGAAYTYGIDFYTQGQIKPFLTGGVAAGYFTEGKDNRWLVTYTNATGSTKSEGLYFRHSGEPETEVDEVFYYRRYQVESLPYPTTWTPGTRAPETATLTLPQGFPEEFGIGVIVRPNYDTPCTILKAGAYALTYADGKVYWTNGTAIAQLAATWTGPLKIYAGRWDGKLQLHIGTNSDAVAGAAVVATSISLGSNGTSEQINGAISNFIVNQSPSLITASQYLGVTL